MEGTPQLLTDVKFSQHRKGYDPDEVDNFLERVSAAVAQLQDKLRQATERAEVADSQLAEARRLQAEAEAAAARAGAGTPGSASSPAIDADEELKKVLLLAQRAADQAVTEANTTATKTVTEARSKALALLAEAEAERDRMMQQARQSADATVEERAQKLRDQVVALEAAKGDLEADVATLDAHLASETERLRAQLASIQGGLDDPRGLRLAETPPLIDTPVPVFESDDEPDVAAAPSESSGSPVIDIQEGPADESAGESAGESDSADGSGDSGSSDDSVAEAEALSTMTAPHAMFDLAAEPDADAPPLVELMPVGEPVPVDDAPEIAIDLTDADVTGSDLDDDPDGGEPTSLFAPSAEEHAPAAGSALGEPDAAADAAMRAFFERDLDEADDAKGSRFGRRR